MAAKASWFRDCRLPSTDPITQALTSTKLGALSREGSGDFAHSARERQFSSPAAVSRGAGCRRVVNLREATRNEGSQPLATKIKRVRHR